MLRAILAVLLGWALVAALVLATDQALMGLFAGEYVEGELPPGRLALLSLATSTLWGAAGGWLCSFIAGRSVWHHAVALILLGELIVGISTALSWGRIQAWYQAGLLLLWPPAVLLGAWLRQQQVKSAGR